MPKLPDGSFRRASTVLMIGHFLLWLSVVVTWIFGWHTNAAPAGPRFDAAFKFLQKIDLFTAASAEDLATEIAIKAQPWLKLDLNVELIVIFSFLLLSLGTAQWFLIGRLLNWLARRFGCVWAFLASCGLVLCVAIALFAWIS